MDNKYQNSKIYKVVDIGYNMCYVGSTYEGLSQRMSKHRSGYKSYLNGKGGKVGCYDIFDKFGVKNCKIELIEHFPCNDKFELRKREGHHIQNNECVNKVVAGRTHEEYYNDNKEGIVEWQKQYYKNNYNKIRERITNYYEQNKEKFKESRNAYQKEYKEKHKDEIKERARKYREEHKEQIKLNREKNKEKNKEYSKTYREQNAEKLKEYKKIYNELKKTK